MTPAVHRLFPFPSSLHPNIPANVFAEFRADSVADPFAGSAIVPVEAWLRGMDGFGADVLPISTLFAEAKRWLALRQGIRETVELLRTLSPSECPEDFEPYADFWFPVEMKPYVCGIAEQIRHYGARAIAECGLSIRNPLFTMLALKVMRKVSYTDPDLLKWMRTKKGIERITKLIEKKGAERVFGETVQQTVSELKSTLGKLPKPPSPEPRLEVRGCWDSVSNPLKAEMLFTSPPYLTVWEYNRTFKVEMFALGFSEDTIKRIGKMELRNSAKAFSGIPPDHKVLRAVCAKAARGKPEIYTKCVSFFVNLFKAIDGSDARIIVLVTGAPRLNGFAVPMHSILIEHLRLRGYKLAKIWLDKIRRKRLRKRMKNPGMGYETVSVLVLP